MSTKRFKPTSAGIRHRVVLDYSEITTAKPERSLLKPIKDYAGRSNGTISVRFRGGRNKRKYRMIDFLRKVNDKPAVIKTIEYDPNRNVSICKIQYKSGKKSYILQPKGLKVGDVVISSNKADIKPGNTLELKNIPNGTVVHNVELKPGKGGQMVRSAGSYATITAKNPKYITLKLPSGEIRLVPAECLATIGQLANQDFRNTRKGKAGLLRKLGFRSSVRGAAMNRADHPHGGGEGKAPVGLSGPLSPTGKKALGKKTRKRNSKLIITRRK